MIGRFSQFLYRISTTPVAIIAAVIFLAFAALVLPRQAAAGDRNVGTPDLSFYYSPQALYQMAESYGETGRQEYIRARFSFDIIWPVVYTSFLVTAIGWLFKRADMSNSRIKLANLMPVLAMVLDLLENISTSIIMSRYPHLTPGLDAIAPFFTSLKWIMVGLCFVLLLAGLVMALRKPLDGITR